MIQLAPLANCERQGGNRPRVGHDGDRFELAAVVVRYDPEQFDVLAIGRNTRTGERWSRLFLQEPDDRQVSRAVDWLLELSGLESIAEILVSS
jgi:hypothetical protein